MGILFPKLAGILGILVKDNILDINKWFIFFCVCDSSYIDTFSRFFAITVAVIFHIKFILITLSRAPYVLRVGKSIQALGTYAAAAKLKRTGHLRPLKSISDPLPSVQGPLSYGSSSGEEMPHPYFVRQRIVKRHWSKESLLLKYGIAIFIVMYSKFNHA